MFLFDKKVSYHYRYAFQDVSVKKCFYFQLDEGWLFGNMYDDDRKTHPLLKPYHLLDERVSYDIV